MNNAVNVVVNNLADKLGEAVETVGTVSRTIVQETAHVGFVYTMIGCALIIVACLSIVHPIYVWLYVDEQKKHDGTVCLSIINAIICLVAGLATVAASLNDWLAPTREVVRELIQNL